MGPIFWEGIKLDASVWWFLRDFPASPENTPFFGLIISWPLVFCFKTFSTWKSSEIRPCSPNPFVAQQFVRPQPGGGWIWQRFSWRKFRKNCFRQTFRWDLYICIDIYTSYIYIYILHVEFVVECFAKLVCVLCVQVTVLTVLNQRRDHPFRLSHVTQNDPGSVSRGLLPSSISVWGTQRCFAGWSPASSEVDGQNFLRVKKGWDDASPKHNLFFFSCLIIYHMSFLIYLGMLVVCHHYIFG